MRCYGPKPLNAWAGGGHLLRMTVCCALGLTAWLTGGTPPAQADTTIDLIQAEELGVSPLNEEPIEPAAEIDPEQAQELMGDPFVRAGTPEEIDPEQASELGPDFDAAQANGIRLAYVWANNRTAASYVPSVTYSHNSAGGTVQITRSGTGRYAVRFAGLGGSGQAGGNVQVTPYGSDSNRCKVRWWSSSGSDFVANVACFRSTGDAVDARYTLLVVWP